MKKLRSAILFPYTFVLLHWAAVAGLYYYARGSEHLWDPAGSRR